MPLECCQGTGCWTMPEQMVFSLFMVIMSDRRQAFLPSSMTLKENSTQAALFMLTPEETPPATPG